MLFLKTLETETKKILNKIAKPIFSQPYIAPKFPINKILIIRPGGIGDMILSIPVIISIKKNNPNSIVEVLCENKNAGVLNGLKEIDKIYVFEKGLTKIIKLVFMLKKNKYDYLLNINGYPSLTYGLIGRIAVPKFVRASGDQRTYSYFFNRIFELPAREKQHMLERLFSIARDLTPESSNTIKQPWFQYPIDVKKLAEDLYMSLLKSMNIEKQSPKIVLVNLSAGLKKREWTVEKYLEFLNTTVPKYLNKIDGWAVIVNPNEITKSKEIVEKLNFPNVVLVPIQKDFRVLISLLEHVFLLISPDTSLVHAASAMGTPVIDLVLKYNIITWSPVGDFCKMIYPKDDSDVSAIEVSEVLEIFNGFIEQLQ